MCDVIAPQGPVHSHPHLPIHKPQRGNMVTHGSLKTPLKEHQQSKIDSTFRNMPRGVGHPMEVLNRSGRHVFKRETNEKHDPKHFSIFLPPCGHPMEAPNRSRRHVFKRETNEKHDTKQFSIKGAQKQERQCPEHPKRRDEKKREKHTSPKHGKGRAETGTPMSKSP